jgi:hypothetical protein
MATCKRCGAEIVPVTAWIEADVAEECQKQGILPFIIRTHQPNPFSSTAAVPSLVMSYPCRHEPVASSSEQQTQ